MTGRQFYDWQTAGGADDVMRMVDALERAELHWCAIGGIAVNHWATEPMVTRDIDFVVAVDEIDRVTRPQSATSERVARLFSIQRGPATSLGDVLDQEPGRRHDGRV